MKCEKCGATVITHIKDNIRICGSCLRKQGSVRASIEVLLHFTCPGCKAEIEGIHGQGENEALFSIFANECLRFPLYLDYVYTCAECDRQFIVGATEFTKGLANES